jgi:hypothetical protein
MTIYATPWDKVDKGKSVDSGFTTLDEAVATVGDNYIYRCARYVTYDGVCFSDFSFTKVTEEQDNGE